VPQAEQLTANCHFGFAHSLKCECVLLCLAFGDSYLNRDVHCFALALSHKCGMDIAAAVVGGGAQMVPLSVESATKERTF
jgi:hypothetical protein